MLETTVLAETSTTATSVSMATAIIFGFAIPLLFWLFDFCTKILAALSTDDVGADLCLLGLSFGLMTIIPEAAKIQAGEASQRAIAVGALGAAVSLVLYVVTLIIISDHSDRPTPSLVRWARSLRWRIELTVFLGIVLVSSELISFLFMLGKKP